MDQYIINEQPLTNGTYEMHNITKGCDNLPIAKDQIIIGFFATFELALRRAKINWPKEKLQGCAYCCEANRN